MQLELVKRGLSALLRPYSKFVPGQTQRTAVNLYHAISIVPGNDACPTAQHAAGKRLLSSVAPSLPLPKCTCENCTCRYKHYDDRRSSRRRVSDQGIPISSWAKDERRKSQSRRLTDH